MLKSGLSILMLAILLMISSAAAQSDIELDVKKHVLPNGMTLLLVKKSTAPVFYSFIYFKVGSANEVGGDIGAAHLLEHMMFKGTKNIGTTDGEREARLMAVQDDLYDRLSDLNAGSRRTNFERDVLGLDVTADSVEAARLRDSIANVSAALAKLLVPNELEELYSENGAYGYNAGTGYDMTSYLVAFPKNRLELFMSIESERLKNPVFREFYTERDVVIEERRLKVDTQGPGKLFEQLVATSFVAHPYQIFWEWKSEVANLTRAEITDFFRTYYGPSQTVMAIVGDIDIPNTIAMAEKYFGSIPGTPVPHGIETVEPAQKGEKRVYVKFNAEPLLNVAYHKTAYDDPDDVVFRVIEKLLASGRTSRFYRNIVEGQRLALYVDISQFPGESAGSLYPNLLVIDAAPKAPATCEDVEEAIYSELDKLKTEPVEDMELQKIKNKMISDFIWGMYSGFGLASSLAEFETTAGDWHYIRRLQDMMSRVTADDIIRVANKYFSEDNRTVAILVPEKEES
jgi:predicted Zn-dependent peptidase